MRWISIAALLLTACATGQVAAEGEPAEARLCANRDLILRQLANKYEEAPIAIGVTSAGGIMELLTSEKGRTWTLIVTRPNGLACLFAAGEGWEPLQRPANEIRY
jgi:hypothetical protein